MKKIIVLLIVILFALSVRLVNAQTSSHSATAISPTAIPSGVPQAAIEMYNIAFPIASLGNCVDFLSCKAYCDDPIHQDVCVAYAKTKGFYTPNPLDTDKEQILAAAKNALGCDSIVSCATYCQDTTHVTGCTAFAQKYNLNAGNANKLNSAATLQQAQQQLGCNSEATCKIFCDNKANQQKCSAFAQSVGLHGGLTKEGPGGCTTENDCKIYCLDSAHLVECEKFGYKPRPSVTPSHTLPSGPFQSEMPVITGSPKNPPPVTGSPIRVSGSPAISTPPNIPVGSNPQAACIANPHCIWTGTLCKCVQATTNAATPAVTSNSSSSTNQTVTTTSNSGTGTVPSTIQQQVKANTNPFPTVKGITTQRTWLQQIINYLFGV